MLQPVVAGLLAALVGFASSFTIVLAGFAAMGATPAEQASALFAVTIGVGILSVSFALVWRMPVSVAWSTPGAALLIASAAPGGGYPSAAGAYLVAAALIVAAGAWRAFGRLVAAIPVTLASAMLAGILFDLCLAPVRAAGAQPLLALPIIAAWAVALRLARPYAVAVAVAVGAIVILATTALPPGAVSLAPPQPLLIRPVFTLDAAIGIGLPLFIVTMASQNLPGLAVMAANGYRAPVGPILLSTGAMSALAAAFGGHAVNLAAITAALCAGPEAHPDPARRWIATLVAGIAYIGLGLGAGIAASFVAAAPPLLIQAVAGLALLGSLGGALSTALACEEQRLPAVVTFLTCASGLSVFGIGAAFWGLLAGGALTLLLRRR